MTEKRFWLVPMDYYGEPRFVKDKKLIGEKSMSNQEVVDLLNEQDKLIRKLSEEVEVHKHPLFSRRQAEEKIERYESDLRMLKKYNKGQELEIIRLHNLADAMSAVLRELGIYDVYNDEQIENVKRRIINV